MKKKGFTLIELLAVIVILALILIIAVPKIIGIIEKAKKDTVEDSARLSVRAVGMAALQNQESGVYIYSSTKKAFVSPNGVEVEIDGTVDEGSTVTVLDGKVTNVNIMKDGYKVTDVDTFSVEKAGLVRVLKTLDVSATASDDVSLKYYSDGSIVISGTGYIMDFEGSNASAIISLFASYFTENQIADFIAYQEVDPLMNLLPVLKFYGMSNSAIAYLFEIEVSVIVNSIENLPENLISIKDFMNNIDVVYPSVKSISVEGNIKNISKDMFAWIFIPMPIKLSNSIEVFDEAAFASSSQINIINIPSSLTTVKSTAFCLWDENKKSAILNRMTGVDNIVSQSNECPED